MSAVAAVVVPAAPALLPGIGGAADPLAGLRGRAGDAVAEVVSAAGAKGAHRCVVVGAGARTTTWPVDAPSGAARFTTGRVPGGALPTAVEIGRMLAPGDGGEPVLHSVDAEERPEDCLALGRDLAADGRAVLVVVADGPATLTEKAPGHVQPDAVPFAGRLREALGAGDAAALATLDPATCDRLRMRGRPALQVLAGAFEGTGPSGRILAEEAPFGVQYVLASWS